MTTKMSIQDPDPEPEITGRREGRRDVEGQRKGMDGMGGEGGRDGEVERIKFYEPN
jgi:hypothetical protein